MDFSPTVSLFLGEKGYPRGMKTTAYENLAQALKGMIRSGTYSPGDKLPSIREMSLQTKRSINTVKEAYNLLERWGDVYAIPQSGFFVEVKPGTRSGISAASHSPRRVEETQEDEYFAVMEEILNPLHVPFGCAGAEDSLLPLGKLQLLGQEVLANSPHWNHYSPVDGFPSLKKAIAKDLWYAGVQTNPDNLVITNGAMEALGVSLRAVTKPGDTVILASPIYFNFLFLFRALGIKILEIPSDPQEGISLEVLQYLLSRHKVAATLLITNFHNPQGVMLSVEKKQGVVALMEEYDCVLIEDDIYGELGYGVERPKTCKSFDTFGRVILCSSYSKTLSPGLRIGFAEPGPYLAEVSRRKTVSNISTSSLSQLVLARFLEEGYYRKHLRMLNKEIKSRVFRMREDILSLFPQGTEVTEPQGGYLLWVKLPENQNSKIVFELAKSQGISITPGHLFSCSFGDTEFSHHIRINAGVYSPARRKDLERLADLLQRNS
jgi:DNA-binding transcriptional MocR family regulator